MTRRYYANAAPQLTLASPITNSATSLTISGTFAGWSATFPFFAVLEFGSANMEIVSVAAIVGTTATVVRGQDGTSGVSHLAGATLDQAFVRQDMDEANAHVNATGAVHGLTGTIVGTSDAQTLTNKTLTSPVINTPTVTSPTVSAPTVTGGTFSDAVNTGDAGNPALVGKATTAGGKTLSLRKADNTEQVGVDDAGNIVTNGNVTAAAGTITALQLSLTGTAVMPSVTASGGVTAGKFVGPVARGFIGETASSSGQALTTAATNYAVTAAGVTFTLTETRRIRIVAQARILPANSAVFAHWTLQAAYSPGSSPNQATFVTVGMSMDVESPSGLSALAGTSEGTALLAAGTYTAHLTAQRFSGGSATDSVGPLLVTAYDMGNA